MHRVIIGPNDKRKEYRPYIGAIQPATRATWVFHMKLAPWSSNRSARSTCDQTSRSGVYSSDGVYEVQDLEWLGCRATLIASGLAISRAMIYGSSIEADFQTTVQPRSTSRQQSLCSRLLGHSNPPNRRRLCTVSDDPPILNNDCPRFSNSANVS